MATEGLVEVQGNLRQALRHEGQAQHSCGDSPCCEGCPLWRRIDLCELPTVRLWICDTSVCDDGSPITPGTVIKHDGACWIVTLITSADPPDALRVEATQFTCYESCNACDPPDGTTCCDQNGDCGLFRQSPPYVFFEGTLRVNDIQAAYRCAPLCDVLLWPYPWRGTALDDRVAITPAIPCSETSSPVSISRQYNISSPCNGTTQQYGESLSHLGSYSIDTDVRWNSPVPVGTANDDEVCIGTSSSPPSPSVSGRFFVQHSTQLSLLLGVDVEMRYAVSMRDPTKWWIYFRQPNSNPAITGTVVCPGGCDARSTVQVRATWTDNFRCDGDDYPVPKMLDVTATGWFDGISTCGGANPGSGDGPDVIAVLSGGPADPGAAALIEKQMRLGGCHGCGDGFKG